MVNNAMDPLRRGHCGTFSCGSAVDFIDVVVGPDGSAWAGFVDDCLDQCVHGETSETFDGVGVLGRYGRAGR
jgi:hypothetical protein